MGITKRSSVPKWQFDTKFTDTEDYNIGMSKSPNRVDESLLFPEDEDIDN